MGGVQPSRATFPRDDAVTDVVVVGGRLFGQVIGAELRRRGREVTLVDADYDESGTYPSGQLLKPSWFAGLGAECYRPALALLERNYKLEELTFQVGLTRATKVMRLPMEQLNWPVETGEVTSVNCGMVEVRDLPPYRPRLVVVAAGRWSGELVEVPGLRGLKGVSFTWTGGAPFENLIRPWAPYKQVVAYRSGEVAWAGDGTALLEKSWTDGRVDECLERCARRVPMTGVETVHCKIGVRPYVRGAKPCYVREVERGVWVATGGAKNGVVAAAWAAHVIAEATC